MIDIPKGLKRPNNRSAKTNISKIDQANEAIKAAEAMLARVDTIMASVKCTNAKVEQDQVKIDQNRKEIDVMHEKVEKAQPFFPRCRPSNAPYYAESKVWRDISKVTLAYISVTKGKILFSNRITGDIKKSPSLAHNVHGSTWHYTICIPSGRSFPLGRI